MMNIVKQMIRGCGALPGIGAHPGTFWLLAFVMIGALAGSEGGWVGALAGAIIMLIGVGPLYLIGAYERAVDSDRAQQRQGAATANDGEAK